MRTFSCAGQFRAMAFAQLTWRENAMIEDRERCLAVGMNDFLAKPLQLHDLKRCLVGLTRSVARIGTRIEDAP